MRAVARAWQSYWLYGAPVDLGSANSDQLAQPVFILIYHSNLFSTCSYANCSFFSVRKETPWGERWVDTTTVADVIASLTPAGQNKARKNAHSVVWANGLMQERDILQKNLAITTVPFDRSIVLETPEALAVEKLTVTITG